MKEHYLKQIEFQKWANSRTLQAIDQAKNPDERALQLVAHILGSSSIWLSRIKSEVPTIGNWDSLTSEKCQLLNETNHINWTEYINNAANKDFERFVQFNFLGEQSKMNISDIITHAINHGSYHRGQIIASLKGKLEVLPLTTYIAFARIAD